MVDTDTPPKADTPAATTCECPICFCSLDTAPPAGDDPLNYFDFGMPERSFVCTSSLSCEAPHFICISCVNRIKLVDHSETSATRLRWRCPICRDNVPVRPFDMLVLRTGNWGAACAGVADVGIEFEGTALKLVVTAKELAQQVEAAASDKPVWSRPSPLRPPQRPPMPRPVPPRPRPRQLANPRRQPPLQPRPPPVTRQRPSPEFDVRFRLEEVLYLSEDEQRLLASTWRSDQRVYDQLQRVYDVSRRRAQQRRMRQEQELMQTMSA